LFEIIQHTFKHHHHVQLPLLHHFAPRRGELDAHLPPVRLLTVLLDQLRAAAGG